MMTIIIMIIIMMTLWKCVRQRGTRQHTAVEMQGACIAKKNSIKPPTKLRALATTMVLHQEEWDWLSSTVGLCSFFDQSTSQITTAKVC